MPKGTYERSPEWRAARSAERKGKRRSPETRARIHASRLVKKDVDPERWETLYRSWMEKVVPFVEPRVRP